MCEAVEARLKPPCSRFPLQAAPVSCALQVLTVGPLRSCLVNKYSRGVVWSIEAGRNGARGRHLVLEGSTEAGGKESEEPYGRPGRG